MPSRSVSSRYKTSGFASEQAANDNKQQHQAHGLVAVPMTGSSKWALVFPLECHVTVIPHVDAAQLADLHRTKEPS